MNKEFVEKAKEFRAILLKEIENEIKTNGKTLLFEELQTTYFSIGFFLTIVELQNKQDNSK